MQAPSDMHPMRPARRLAGVSIGGILAILAVVAILVIGYLFVRDRGTGDVQAEADQQTTELQEGFDAAEARTRLSTLRSEIEAGLDQDAILERYEDIRSDLEAGYADVDGEAAERWTRLETRLDELGQQIGESTEEALATIDTMLEDFPQE